MHVSVCNFWKRQPNKLFDVSCIQMHNYRTCACHAYGQLTIVFNSACVLCGFAKVAVAIIFVLLNGPVAECLRLVVGPA